MRAAAAAVNMMHTDKSSTITPDGAEAVMVLNVDKFPLG